MQFHGSILQSETISKETTDSYFHSSRYFRFIMALALPAHSMEKNPLWKANSHNW